MTARAEEALRALAELVAPIVARAVVAELRFGSAEMVDQHASPLGPRRHAAAVRRRVSDGKGGALVAGRRLLLTREALSEETAALNARAPRKRAPASQTTRAQSQHELAERYGLKLLPESA